MWFFFPDLHHLCRPPSIYNVLQFQLFYFLVHFITWCTSVPDRQVTTAMFENNSAISLFVSMFTESKVSLCALHRLKIHFVWQHVCSIWHNSCLVLWCSSHSCQIFFIGQRGRVHFRVKYLWYFQEFCRLTVTHISVHLILFIHTNHRKLINHCIQLYCLLCVTHLQEKCLLVILFVFMLSGGYHKTSTLSLCHLKDLFS